MRKILKTKNFIWLAVFSMILVAPSFVSAVTVDDLQAIIVSLQQQIQQLQSQLSQLQSGGGATTSIVVPCASFNTNLKLGSTGTDVSSLQTTLEAEGFGISQQEQNQKSFGQSTASAVNNFQEKYKGEILTPLGLNNGTGFVGVATRTKLNKLYRCGGITTSSCITDIMCVEGYISRDSGRKYPNGCPILECASTFTSTSSCITDIMCAEEYESHDSGRKYSNGCPILECIPASTSSCVPEGGSLSAAVSTTASQLKCCSGLSPSISTGGGTCVKPLTITTTSLPNGIAGTSYLAGITGSGGSGGYSWSATGVPSGLVFSTGQCTPVLGSTCLPPAQISGIPTFAGTYTITITLKSSNNETASKSFTLTVTDQNQTCTNKWWFDSNTTACSYKQFCGEYMYQGLQTFSTETACKAALPISCVGNGGSLGAVVPGNNLKCCAGLIASIPSGVEGTRGTCVKPLTITNTSLPSGKVDTAYSTEISGDGGSGTYMWSATGVPPGMNFSGLMCFEGPSCMAPAKLSGTPTWAGTYTITVTLKTSNNETTSKSFTLTIADNPITIKASLPSGEAGSSYSGGFTATSYDTTKSYEWFISGLPPGLAISYGECMAVAGYYCLPPATIWGTPTTAGTYTIAVGLKLNGVMPFKLTLFYLTIIN